MVGMDGEDFDRRQGMPFKDVNAMSDTDADDFIKDITSKMSLTRK